MLRCSFAAKSGAREQPISKRLAKFLNDHVAALPKEIPKLFPSPAAKKGHTVNIRKPFRRVVEAAGLDPDQVVRHTLRHTTITHLVQAGVDLPIVKRISGHKTLTMVLRYAHVHGDHIDRAISAIGREIPEPIENRTVDATTQKLHIVSKRRA